MHTSVGRAAIPVAAAILIASAGTAWAGPWYYEWSCTGECAPGRLAIDGREGPFASRADCEYARDHDPRADEFVAPGNLGGLEFCEEDTSQPTGSVTFVAATPPANKVRITAVEIGVALGGGWAATSEGGMVTRGPATIGFEIDSHTGRDVGGGAIQLGVYGAWVEAPMLGESARAVLLVPLSVGLALTPQVWSRGPRSARLDLGASLGGLLLLGCGDCGAPVFDETISFGYTLKAGVDVFLSKTSGVGVDVVFPRWQLGSASAGNLQLDSPTAMLRLSLINRPPAP